ncbi:hypothetical protein N7463_009459 [Penicillium fimorum]|uniref:tRNA-splicing endonuclease subunit Sen54 N-terminal domain-containing protein n=1 Tax=Penicillium fimorum TaxID=1882269 RepID=A0A9W9XQS7_9EURO|nr:hypothetical protein N7463_009459 [Penicillium fimorum]
MADVDEDAIKAPANASTEPDVDLSDETQDFRFLNHLNFFADASPGIPRRGEKDFEPNPTELQADVLSASRGAMHNALSYPRLHNTKTRVVAFYAPDGYVPPVKTDRATPKTGGEDEKSSESTPKPPRPLPNSARISPDACVYVPNPKGQFFKTMGQADSLSRVWLLPEEALYLIERGNGLAHLGPPAGPGEEDLSVPMSLQAAYACFMGHGGLTLERYSVYTGLKRLGYALLRAPGWCDDLVKEDADASYATETTPPTLHGPGLAGILGSLFNWIHDPRSTASTATGPIIGTGIHRNYMDIYRKLAIIPWYDPITAPERHPADTTPPFRVVFHVFKPSTPFKKSAPPTPDFRVAVVSTRDQTTMPTMTQLGALLESTPLDPPARGENGPLRHGYRNVVMAVVDQGVVSYLRVADSAFGKEKLYENKGGPQGPKWNRNQKPRKR